MFHLKIREKSSLCKILPPRHYNQSDSSPINDYGVSQLQENTFIRLIIWVNPALPNIRPMDLTLSKGNSCWEGVPLSLNNIWHKKIDECITFTAALQSAPPSLFTRNVMPSFFSATFLLFYFNYNPFSRLLVLKALPAVFPLGSLKACLYCGNTL